MGCSPYFVVTGTHPLIPLDIVKANYLLLPPDSLLSTTDLIAHHMITLQKRQGDLVRLKDRIHTAQNRAVIHFKQENSVTIHDFGFDKGDLVLVQNMSIEKALNQKMHT